MKINIQVVKSQKPAAGNSPLSRQGMALVITLIMLSVTLVMAIAFLAIARRERVSVSTSTDATVARLASDTALAAAQAQILAGIQVSNSAMYNYNLLVSTNYINPNGFNNNAGTFLTSPNNVSYYYQSGNLVAGQDFDQNVANLMFLPRAPVMVSPSEPAGRFYLDLNRNGAFEDTGWVANATNQNGYVPLPGNFANGTIGTNGTIFEVGDPQWVGVLERPGQPHAADNQFVSRYAFIALPVGEALDLNFIHNQGVTETVNPASGGNDGFMRDQGVGSWELNFAAFLADLNTNQWMPAAPPANVYYAYNEPFSINRGLAFDDARSLLSWRYNYAYNNLSSVRQLFGFSYNILSQDNVDFYDRGLLLQTSTTNIVETSPAIDPVNNSWPGADNPNKFYTPADFFDSAKSSGGVNSFTNRLLNAGSTAAANGARPEYDRYTFYRLLDQLGTDTLPANAGKLNLNYQNANLSYGAFGQFVNATVVSGMETNLYSWNPRDFFCAAADQLLKVYTTNWFQADPSNFLVNFYGLHLDYSYVNAQGAVIHNDPTGFGLTNWPFNGMTNQVPAFGLGNLPVQVNGNFVYTPAVNRLLQLAANILDAGTNDFYPHVFRPIFYRNPVTSDIFIAGYTNVDSVSGGADPKLNVPNDLTALANNYSTVNIYGLPWIIGAKKYIPSFNEFYSYNTLQVQRKLQFNRQVAPSAWSGSGKGNYYTNQMIIMSITNRIGFSFWNSYVANYPGSSSVEVYARDTIKMRLSSGSYNYDPAVIQFPFYQQMPVWPGSGVGIGTSVIPSQKYANTGSFVSASYTYPFVHEAALDLDQAGNVVGTGFRSTTTWNTNVTSMPAFPSFELDTTNRFQGFILDNGHVLDYVNFFGPSSVRDLGADLKDPDYTGANQVSPMWSTNLTGSGTPPSGVNWGVQNQITVSQTAANIPPTGKWQFLGTLPSGVSGTAAEAAMFKGFITPFWTYGGKSYANTNLHQQAPYTPTRTVIAPTLWVVNDPMVHYLTADLMQTLAEVNHVTNGVAKSDDFSMPPITFPNLTQIQSRYQPWGRNSQMNEISGVLHDDPENASYNLSYRDPLVYGSDNWDFPYNKYPSVGWLGRVHRGTPWQTVYLKATNLLDFVDSSQGNPSVGRTTWSYWTGNFNSFDSLNTRPIQDELLFDIFTAAPNDNAARGTLSVNQKHLAAWSAVFGGLLVISNITAAPAYNTSPIQTNVVINPAGVDQANSPLYQIVDGPNGINATRGNLYGAGGFPRAGDILRTPALTQYSPFLNTSGSAQLQYDVSDEMYEWLPQQIMSLVRSTGNPRYAIYSYGHTLKPATDGMVLSSATLPSGYNPFGLVTNYQVVAESATRAVVTVQPVLTNMQVALPGGGFTVVPVTNYTTKVEGFNVLPPQ